VQEEGSMGREDEGVQEDTMRYQGIFRIYITVRTRVFCKLRDYSKKGINTQSSNLNYLQEK